MPSHPSGMTPGPPAQKWTCGPNAVALPVVNGIYLLKTISSPSGKQLPRYGQAEGRLVAPICHRNISSKATCRAPRQSHGTASEIPSSTPSQIWCAMISSCHTTPTRAPDSGLVCAPSKPRGSHVFSEKREVGNIKVVLLGWVFFFFVS